MAWYAFLGGDRDVLSSTSYLLLPGFTLTNPPSCRTGCIICAIYLDQTDQVPSSIPSYFSTLIPLALVSGAPQSLVPSGPYYVLLRC